jgi:hypothetical protein
MVRCPFSLSYIDIFGSSYHFTFAVLPLPDSMEHCLLWTYTTLSGWYRKWYASLNIWKLGFASYMCISSIPKCRSFQFCPKSNFSNFNQVYMKRHQYLQHQIWFIKCTMKYVLIVHLSGVDVNIFSYKLGQVREDWLRTKLK